MSESVFRNVRGNSPSTKLEKWQVIIFDSAATLEKERGESQAVRLGEDNVVQPRSRPGLAVNIEVSIRDHVDYDCCGNPERFPWLMTMAVPEALTSAGQSGQSWRMIFRH